MKLDIPEGLTEDRMSRSKHLIPTEIISEVTVNKGSRRIDFRTLLFNRCKEHMLVVSFPTKIDAEYAYWESPFEIRMRDVDKYTDNFGKKGSELERQAMQSFIDVNDGKNGFALFTKGLKEVGTTCDNGAIINLTLFRACSNTFPIHNDLQISFEKETSQCIGEQVFEYSVFIHKGDVESGNVIKESRKYIIPLISAEVGYGKGGTLKGNTSFMNMKSNTLIICAIKLSENGEGIIIRLNNPTDKTIYEKIEFMNQISEAYLTDMNEEPVEKLEKENNLISIEIKPYKILTLFCTFI